VSPRYFKLKSDARHNRGTGTRKKGGHAQGFGSKEEPSCLDDIGDSQSGAARSDGSIGNSTPVVSF